MRPHRSCLVIGLVAAALAFGWQALTVHFNYGGNGTALFCTGSDTRVPPGIAAESLYKFAGSGGYDGQYYHFMAHDPLLRRGFSDFFDAPRLRCRRMLVPAAAWLLAGGRDEFVDTALFAVMAASVYFGAYWLSRYAVSLGAHPAWGLGFLFVPAVIISLDRFTVDATMAALVAGFLLYSKEEDGWRLYAVLLAAVMTRETGLLLLGGCILFLAWKRRWLRAFVFSTAALPALGWYFYIHSRTGGYETHLLSRLPAETFFRRLMEPIEYSLPPAIARTATILDYLALAATASALVFAAWFALRKSAGPADLAGLLFSIMGAALGGIVGWSEPFGHPRTFSPVLMLVAARGLATGSWWAALPLCLHLPRISMQLGPQLLGIARALGIPV